MITDAITDAITDHIMARIHETKQVKSRIWQAIQTGDTDHLGRDLKRGRALGLDVAAIVAQAREAS